jgi:hypothetical protein
VAGGRYDERDRPEIWEIMTIGIGPVGYVAGWGSAYGLGDIANLVSGAL